MSTSSAYADHPSPGLGISGAGPIVTESAFTAGQGQWGISLETEYQDLTPLPDAVLVAASEDHQDVHSAGSVMRTSLAVGYGVTDRLTLSISLPFIRRTNIREGEHTHGAPDAVTLLGNSQGVGDASLLATVRLLGNASARTQLSLLLGLRLPTGRTGVRIASDTTAGGEDDHGHMSADEDVAHHGDRFEAEHQPGSGSWDPFVGLAIGHNWGRSSLHASAVYAVANSGSQHTNLGDSLFYGIAWVYRLAGANVHQHPDGHHHNHDAPQQLRLDVMLELTGEWRGRQKIDGKAGSHSGGHVVYLAPGLRLTLPAAWSLSLSVGIPVHRDLHGLQSKPRWRLLSGLSKVF